MESTLIEKYYEGGKYDKILALLENLKGTDKLEGEIYRLHILSRRTKVDEAINLGERVVKETQQNNLHYLELLALVTLSGIHRIKYRETRHLQEDSDSRKHQNLQLKLLNKVENLLQNYTDLSKREKAKITCLLLFNRSTYYKSVNDFPQSLLNLDRCENLAKKFNFHYLLADIYQQRGIEKENKMDFEQAGHFYQKSLEKFETLNNIYEQTYLYYNIGWCYYSAQKIDLARENIKNGLDLSKKNNDLDMQSNFHIMLGWTFWSEEQSDIALIEFKKGEELANQTNHLFNQAWTLGAQGWTYIGKGDLDLAEKYLQQALEKKLIQWWIEVLFGELYWQKNLLDKSIKYFETGLRRWEQEGKMNFSFPVCIQFLNIISVSIEGNQRKKSFNYLQKFQELMETNPVSSDMKYCFQLAQAIILKSSTRLKDKFKAQELYESIIKSELITTKLKLFTLLHLCDLLILEYTSQGEEEVLSDLENSLSQIIEIATKSKLYPTLINSLIIKSKLSLADKNIKKTEEILSECKQLAKNHNLDNLLKKINLEEKELYNELHKWNVLMKGNTSTLELLEKSRLQDYIKEAISVSQTKLPRQ